MFKYVLTFSKTGIICYTSHLDIMRMFNRVIKRAGIRLSYSQGFNPHPKMGFAQPLSLGYSGLTELMELETEEEYEPEDIKDKLTELMPKGIDILKCEKKNGASKKTLAAQTVAAAYKIYIPISDTIGISGEEIKNSYMNQNHITALKRQKKKKEPVEIDIKPMIRELEIINQDHELIVEAVLDSGSISNLSPELLIKTLQKHLSLDIDRGEIEITREKIYFQ